MLSRIWIEMKHSHLLTRMADAKNGMWALPAHRSVVSAHLSPHLESACWKTTQNHPWPWGCGTLSAVVTRLSYMRTHSLSWRTKVSEGLGGASGVLGCCLRTSPLR